MSHEDASEAELKKRIEALESDLEDLRIECDEANDCSEQDEIRADASEAEQQRLLRELKDCAVFLRSCATKLGIEKPTTGWEHGLFALIHRYPPS